MFTRPRPASASRGAETADGGWTPPRLVAAGAGGSVGCEAGDGELGREEVGKDDVRARLNFVRWRFSLLRLIR